MIYFIDYFKIIDENKCYPNSKDCDIPHSVCSPNESNEYSCECVEGFYKLNNKCLGNKNNLKYIWTLKLKIERIDINECHLKLHDCDSESSCINTIGSFYCKCTHGFEIDDFKKCHGIINLN